MVYSRVSQPCCLRWSFTSLRRARIVDTVTIQKTSPIAVQGFSCVPDTTTWYSRSKIEKSRCEFPSLHFDQPHADSKMETCADWQIHLRKHPQWFDYRYQSLRTMIVVTLYPSNVHESMKVAFQAGSSIMIEPYYVFTGSKFEQIELSTASMMRMKSPFSHPTNKKNAILCSPLCKPLCCDFRLAAIVIHCNTRQVTAAAFIKTDTVASKLVLEQVAASSRLPKPVTLYHADGPMTVTPRDSKRDNRSELEQIVAFHVGPCIGISTFLDILHRFAKVVSRSQRQSEVGVQGTRPLHFHWPEHWIFFQLPLCATKAPVILMRLFMYFPVVVNPWLALLQTNKVFAGVAVWCLGMLYCWRGILHTCFRVCGGRCRRHPMGTFRFGTDFLFLKHEDSFPSS